MKLVLKLLLLIVLQFPLTSTHAQEKSKQDILASLGNASKWNSIHYLLFSSKSVTNNFKEHTFLIDKSTGKARFDGKTSDNTVLTLLFNYKTKILNKSFVDGRLNEDKSSVPYQEVLDQLFDDTKLLFLPMLIISSPNQLTIGDERMIQSEKLVEVYFKKIYSLNKTLLNGSIYLNSKGEIKEYHIDQSTFLVGEMKDIGDGIVLATKFTNKSKNLTIKFNTVAAFTTIEAEKFTKL